MIDTNHKGEYRSLTPQEVGKAVTILRKAYGIKQLTLALDAGVVERTVQRIENGERVSDDTLRQIAKAMRLEETAFIKRGYIPTTEEILPQVNQILSEIQTIQALRLSDERDCDSVLLTGANMVDDSLVAPELAEEVAAFKDLLLDSMNLYDADLSNVDRLQVCRSILECSRRIEARGYVIYYGVYTSQDHVRASVLTIFQNDDERAKSLKLLLVPRNIYASVQSLQEEP